MHEVIPKFTIKFHKKKTNMGEHLSVAPMDDKQKENVLIWHGLVQKCNFKI